MTADEVLTGVLAREGGWRPQVTRPDGSVDPATNLGITLPTLRAWRKNPTLTADDLKEMHADEARLIYRQVYIGEPGFTSTNIPFEPLRVQLIDFGVNSGPERAVRWLQRVMGYTGAAITGRMDAQTCTDLRTITTTYGRTYWALLNDALVAARAYMIDQAVDHGTIRRQDEEGLESRALSFFLARS